jgi:hypothetical protein
MHSVKLDIPRLHEPKRGATEVGVQSQCMSHMQFILLRLTS